MKHHSQTVFVPSDTVEMFVDHAGHAPRPMPKVDAGNQATVVSSAIAASVHFGGAITDPNAKAGTIHIAAGETILLTGPNALAAAVADRIFVLAPGGGHMKIMRGTVDKTTVFHD